MYDSKLRLRLKSKPVELLPQHYYGDKARSKSSLPIPLNHFILHLLLLITIYVIIVFLEERLPTPLLIKDESLYPNRFIAERAQNYLKNLTRLGPRPVGSFENEVLALNFFSKEINAIMNNANKIHRIIYDLQKVSGSFPLTFLDGMTNIYKDVQNVIVKIGPQEESDHSLLVNCHFDTVIDSPGGSDDGASCAVMLEILRIISKQETPLKHNIIFLFNGAEENFMQASHGFITQHKWARSIRAFVNLEACGAGGREILFQAGPEHPWLIQTYSDIAPHPLASSLAQEIFQSGLVPGDTDYRIFRDFGKVSGLDFAWSLNGYVYHTRLDDVHQIPLGSLQHTGDNMLPLILTLVNSEYLANVQAHSKGNLVFFDFLGIFIVSGREIIASVINIVIIIASLYSVLNNMKQGNGIPRKVYVKGMSRGVIFILLSWLLTLLLVVMLAQLITILNRPLSWYARPVWIFFLYIIPTFIVPIFFVNEFKKRTQITVSSPQLLYQIYSDSNLCIFITFASLLTLFQIRSTFIVSIWLGFSFLGWSLKRKFQISEKSGSKQLWLYSFALLIPFTLSAYIIYGVSLFIVPIMGRSGSGNHAELVLSFIMSVMLMLLFSFYIPMTLIVKNLKVVIKSLTILFLSAVLVLLFTPLGFPYSGDLSAPAPQRYIISHVDRTFYNINGSIRRNDSGLWVVNMDVNSPRMVTGLIPEMARAKPINNCDSELYCALPYIIPVMTIMWDTHWIPSPKPLLPSEIELNLSYRDYRPNKIQRLSFAVKGPDHMTLFVSPYPGVELKSWSLVAGPPLKGPPWKNRSTYFVYYSYGSDPQTWNFWMDLVVPHDHDLPLIDVGLTGYFVHGPHQTTPQLKKLFSQFPPWTVTSGWTATYKSYTF